MLQAIVLISLTGLIAMKHKPILQTTLLLIVIFLTTPVYANCTAITVNGSSFGNVSAIDANVSNYHLADIIVTCANSNDSYSLGLESGSSPSSGYRHLVNAGQTIAYTLFQGNTSIQWGDDGLTNTFPNPAFPVSGSGSNTYAVYANAATKDKTPAGLYSDIVNVILKNSDTTIVTSATHFNLYLDAFCSLNIGSEVGNFGRYPVGHTSIINVSLGSVIVTCPANISYKIGINMGLHSSGSARRMSLNDQAFIPYLLRCNGVAWGDKGMNAININYVETSSTENACSPTNTNGSPERFTISGDAEIQNATTIGTYTDTLIVTLVW
jgi:spore coat protein U-like protein